MKEIVEFINTVGFPIFVAVFMLVKQNKDQKATNTILVELKGLIEQMSQNCVRKVG